MASWSPLSHKRIINKTDGILVLQINQYCQTCLALIPKINDIMYIAQLYLQVHKRLCVVMKPHNILIHEIIAVANHWLIKL